jgi:hypothetical protein
MTYLPTSNKIYEQKFDQSNAPYSNGKKNHPNHNGHVKSDLSKMMEWFFLTLLKLGSFKLYLLVKTIFSSSDLSSYTKQPKILMCYDS